MSPRSEEFMAEARERLAGARSAARAGFGSLAVGAAYYAMLYAARAALSEQELNAKTHSGVWTLFRRTFVTSGRLDAELTARAQRLQELREEVDYEASGVTDAQVREAIADAKRFVATVETMLAA
jgi:uncharacterized protein (UPF0332 family)